MLTLFAIVLAVCATAGAKPTLHRGNRATIATIQALEEQWRQAQLTGDAVMLDKLLSDDFVGITASGQVTTKTQQLDRTRSRDIVITTLDLSDVKVKLLGDRVAIVTSLAMLVGTSSGAPLAGTFRYTRVYQNLAGGGWRITSFEATRVPTGHGKHAAATAAAAEPSRP